MPIVNRTIKNAFVIQSLVKVKTGEVVRLVLVVITHAKRRQTSITTIRTVLEAGARAKAFNCFVVTIELAGGIPRTLIEAAFLLFIAKFYAFGVQGHVTKINDFPLYINNLRAFIA